MTLSVAMATYNGAAWLPEQLASLAAQDQPPDELVVCDDASTDNSPALVEAFAGRVPFAVHLIRNSCNRGSTASFARAIEHTRMDLIALCDQDDVWRRDKLRRMCSALADHPDCGAAVSDAQVVGPRLEPLPRSLWQRVGLTPTRQRLLRKGQGGRVLAGGNVVTGCTLVFRARFKGRILPMVDGIVHDAWIAWLIAATGPLLAVPARLVQYRQHTANQIGIPPRGVAALLRTGLPGSKASMLESLACEADVVVERLVDLGLLTNEYRRLLAARAAHLRFRARLPSSHVARVPLIFARVMRGHYRRYSNGVGSALGDLMAKSGAG
jgi:glycosyltransferase involved in cell wall biosynthesis